MSGAQRIALIAVGAVVAIAAFVLLRPDDDGGRQSGPPRTNERTTERPTPARPEGRSPPARIVVRGGRPVGGPGRLAARHGEVVRFEVVSDVAEEVHVHGYDISRPVRPGRPVRFRFTAELEGVFEVELERRHQKIASLEVRP